MSEILKTTENIDSSAKVSVVIPTLQKNTELLINLLKTLEQDSAVSEIILIDNSGKGLEYTNSKLKLIIPEENMFVNPSWNYGTKIAEYPIVALLNDDITISSDFCSRVAEQMNPDMGCVGFDIHNIVETQEIKPPIEYAPLHLEETRFRGNHWGIAIFFYKSSYVEIPEDIKIFCGDDWIFLKSKINKRKNYIISGQNIYHYGSLSSASKALKSIGDKDRKLYRKYTRKWWNFIFNIEPIFKGFRLTLFGIEILYHYSKKH